jgi:hypothetical protein
VSFINQLLDCPSVLVPVVIENSPSHRPLSLSLYYTAMTSVPGGRSPVAVTGSDKRGRKLPPHDDDDAALGEEGAAHVIVVDSQLPYLQAAWSTRSYPICKLQAAC